MLNVSESLSGNVTNIQTCLKTKIWEAVLESVGCADNINDLWVRELLNNNISEIKEISSIYVRKDFVDMVISTDTDPHAVRMFIYAKHVDISITSLETQNVLNKFRMERQVVD